MDDLLKEAIADAKAVRETALENAKMALEEAFTPRLQSMLSQKIQTEMEDDDEKKEEQAKRNETKRQDTTGHDTTGRDATRCNRTQLDATRTKSGVENKYEFEKGARRDTAFAF